MIEIIIEDAVMAKALRYTKKLLEQSIREIDEVTETKGFAIKNPALLGSYLETNSRFHQSFLSAEVNGEICKELSTIAESVERLGEK